MRSHWLALALGAALSASCGPAMQTASTAPRITSVGVRFELVRADATSVAVAGTFNQWSASSHPMMREENRGAWTVLIPLPAGEHRFMYVVNGTEWISPPAADDYIDDGFGAKNGIVVVRSTER